MRLNVRRSALVGASVLALAAVVVGCTGSEDDEEFGDYGGEVQVLHLFNGAATEVVQGAAYFYSDYVPATGENAPGADPYPIPDDVCLTDAQLAITATDGNYVAQNVGSAVRIVGAGGTVEYPMLADGFYATSAASPADVPDGSTADIEWDVPATTLGGAIDIPIEIVFTAPDPASATVVVPTNGDMTFTWTTHGGNTTLIRFLASEGGICRVADDGSFAVPASFLAAINATSGTVAFVGGQVGFENAVVGTAGLEKSVHTIGFVGRAWFY